MSDLPPHGTMPRYNRLKCRCAECRNENREYVAEYRRNKKRSNDKTQGRAIHV